ncbi:LytR/AlgR family response regulator transcription factor [Algoriphagus hitonicola]|uniref:Two component transcriptional regulator, LytTR family n=1 Tax=Algoriphagus hitonicola TaxID=435880 RepID=A0A1I2NMI2_9BACT|nr:LytTR family DNA-binding domain-containing protein [Algoriphagus hitonicola]SFG02656.1 two component transcriptional regulator, LytTR family [Algoriphagus hitonicola]
MIHILILEDEIPAQKKLVRYLKEMKQSTHLVDYLESVADGIEFLSKHPKLDLIISDIELRDGNAFQIFDEIKLPCPIIFTTAYHEFWMQAFEGNGIAYLLKPFSLDKFQQAWDKFLFLSQKPANQSAWLEQIQQLMDSKGKTKPNFKTRITVPNARGTYFLEISQVIFFLAENGVVFAVDRAEKKHLLKETTLKQIEAFLDPKQFFRINRSEVINKDFVQATERYSKNSVAIKLSGLSRLLICSQNQTPDFLKWMEE